MNNVSSSGNLSRSHSKKTKMGATLESTLYSYTICKGRYYAVLVRSQDILLSTVSQKLMQSINRPAMGGIYTAKKIPEQDLNLVIEST